MAAEDGVLAGIHQALFHVPTGEIRASPATEPLRTFAVKTEGQLVLVELGEK
jgi:3-phenylpropionate/trans-cinnamate dioxygenase ferredoxin component